MDEVVGGEESPEVDDGKCKECGAEPEGGWLYPLCANCRRRLNRTGLPTWLVVSAVLVGGLLVVALAQSPGTWAGTVAFERGKRAESAQKYDLAEQQYQKALERFDDSTTILERLAVAAFYAEDYRTAAESVDKLAGREATSDASLAEVDDVTRGLEKKAREYEEEEKRSKKK